MSEDFSREAELRALQDEAREWIEALTGETFASDDWVESMKDGVLLCKLINVIAPGSVKRINQSKMPFKKMENIANFLKGARAFGMKEFEMFGTPDLYDEKNIRQVVSSIHALGRTVQDKLPDWGKPTLGIKVVEKKERVWTEEQLRQANTAVSLLNLGSSDHGKKAAMGVLDGTGEIDEAAKGVKTSKAAGYREQMMRDSAHRKVDSSKLDRTDFVDPASVTLDVGGGDAGASAGAGAAVGAESGAGAGTDVSAAATSATAAGGGDAAKAGGAAGGGDKATAGEVAGDGKWQEMATEDGTPYYQHVDTLETIWELGPGQTLVGSGGDAGAAAAGGGNDAAAAGDGKWEEMATEDGTPYFQHVDTLETIWELGPGQTLVGSDGGGGGDGGAAAGGGDASAAGDGKWTAMATEDGTPYYQHVDTAETIWELGPGQTLAPTDDAAAAGEAAADGEGDGKWQEMATEDGTPYYQHVDTLETIWELGPGQTLAPT